MRNKHIKPRTLIKGLLALSVLLPSVAFAQTAVRLATDVDGDGRGDIIRYNPSTSTFFVRSSQTLQITETQLGSIGDVPIPGDYDGDGSAELRTYNRTTGVITDTGSTTNIGQKGDIPMPADWDGDGDMDFALFRPSTNTWLIYAASLGSTSSTFTHGDATKVLLAGDIDCDNKADAIAFNKANREWSVRKSSDSTTETFFFGLRGDIPIVGDFNGNGCESAGVFRPDTYQYYASTGYVDGNLATAGAPVQWGLYGDVPMILDVDGNEALDYAAFRPDSASYFLKTDLGTIFLLSFPLAADALILPFGLSYGDNLEALFDGPLSEVPSEVRAGGVPVFASSVRLQRRIPGDYNGDGRSDLVAVRKLTANSTTTWAVKHANNTSSIYNLSHLADAYVPNDYNGDGKTQPATVFVKDDGGLEWRVSQPSGAELTFAFGLNGDSPLSGDFDCDGKADYVVTRADGFFKRWFYILQDGTDNINSSGELFGFATDTAFAADIDGDGCDEMVVGRSLNGGIDWWYKKLGSNSLTYVQWGLAGDTILAPADMDGDSRADFIIVRAAGGANYAYIRFARGGSGINFLGSSVYKVMTGNYTGLNRSEFAVYLQSSSSSATGSYFIIRGTGQIPVIPFGTSEDFIIRPDGTVAGSGTTDSGGGGGGGAGCTPSSGTEGDFVDGGEGALWKPHSEGVSNGAPAILMPTRYKDASIQVLGSDGTEVSGIQRTRYPDGHTNGNRMHWWPAKTAGSLSAFKPLTIKFVLNGVTECRSVPNPQQRYD
jgi:hypothetical protein